jgi:hypothetical protein
MSAKGYGTVGIVGVAGFLLAILALHFLDPDLSVVDATVSDYALGDYGWLARAGDFSSAVGVIAIALGLRLTLAQGKRVTASWVLLFIAGLGFLASGLFVTNGTEATDFTAAGIVHLIAGVVSILALVVAAWMLRGVFSRNAGYRHLSRTQHWFAILITAALVGNIVLSEVAEGLSQRVFIAVMVVWWFVLAANVRRFGIPRHISEQDSHA